MPIQSVSGSPEPTNYFSSRTDDPAFLKFEGELIELAKAHAKEPPNASATKSWLPEPPLTGFSRKQIKHLISQIISSLGNERAQEVIDEFSKERPDKDFWERRVRVEKAKSAAVNDPEETDKIITANGIEDEADRIEIAKFVAERDGRTISMCIHKWKIEDEEALVEIAKIAAKQNKDALLLIQNYRFKNLESLRKVISPLDTSDPFIAPYLESLDKPTLDEALIKIAEINASRSGLFTSIFFQNYNIKDPDTRFNIAMISAEQNAWSTAGSIKNYDIRDEKSRIEIAMKIASCGSTIMLFIGRFDIQDQKALVEIVKIAAEKSGAYVSQYFPKLGIEDEIGRVEIAKIAAAQDGEAVSKNFSNYNIQDEKARIEIAKIAAAQSGEGVSENLSVYRIEDIKSRIAIAKIAAKQDGMHTSLYIKNYDIQDENDRIEIAKIAAAQNGRTTLYLINNYDIQDKEDLKDVFLIALGSDPSSLEFLPEFYPDEITKEYIPQKLPKGLKEDEAIAVRFVLQHALQRGEEDSLTQSLLELKNPTARKRALQLVAQYADKLKELNEVEELEKQINEAKARLDAAKNNDAYKEQLKKIRPLENNIKTAKDRLDAAKKDVNKLVKEAQEELKNLKREPPTQELEERIKTALDNLKRVNSDPRLNDVKEAEEELRKAKEELKEVTDSEEHGVYRQCLAEITGLEGRLDKVIKLAQRNKYATMVQKPEDIAFTLMRIHKNVQISVASGNEGMYTFGELRDAQLTQQILITFYDLLTEEELEQSHLENLLNLATLKSGSGNKIRALQKISAIMALDRVDLLKETKDLDKSLEEAFMGAVGLQGIEGFSDKFLDTFMKFRDPQALFVYAGQLKNYSSQVSADLRTYIEDVLNGEFQKNRSEGLDPRWVAGAEEQITLTSSGSSLNFKQLVETSVRDGHISDGVIERVRPYLNDPTIEVSTDLETYERELILLAREGVKHLQPLQKALGDYTGSQRQIVNDVEGWVKALSASSGSTREYTLLDGDDPCDFLLMGTEVVGSCQRVDGNPEKNKGLVGTMLDGHNRLLLLKDVSGKIVGRNLLRLVKEGEKPALLLERVYPQTLGSAEKEQLMNFAKKRSEALGWPLYGVEFEGKETSVTLTSEGGRGTYQYVDSAGGNQPNGKFTIPKPKLLS